MSRDSVSNEETLPKHKSLRARRGRIASPTDRSAMDERRADITRIFEYLGPVELAAKFEALPGAIAITRVNDGMIRVMNDDCVRLLGHSYSGHAGKTADDLSIWVDPAGRDRFVAACRERRDVTDMETLFRRVDGTVIPVSISGRLLEVRGELYVLSVARDITARTRAEDELRRSLESAVRVVSEVVELRDPYTGSHQRRVSELAARIAREMRIPAAQTEEIRIAALIHDVGKMAVPVEILSKPGDLSALEFSLIKVHPEAGRQIIRSAGMAGDAAEIVYQHHERCDGSGYPRGLSGDQLILGARVLMVADVFEAMSSHRPYRPALGVDVALEEIDSGAGTRYHADVCRACGRVVREPGFRLSEPQAE